MAFKEYSRRPSFLEIELSSVMGKSRTQQLLSEIDSNINWAPIEAMITSRYPVGHSILKHNLKDWIYSNVFDDLAELGALCYCF